MQYFFYISWICVIHKNRATVQSPCSPSFRKGNVCMISWLLRVDYFNHKQRKITKIRLKTKRCVQLHSWYRRSLQQSNHLWYLSKSPVLRMVVLISRWVLSTRDRWITGRSQVCVITEAPWPMIIILTKLLIVTRAYFAELWINHGKSLFTVYIAANDLCH